MKKDTKTILRSVFYSYFVLVIAATLVFVKFEGKFTSAVVPISSYVVVKAKPPKIVIPKETKHLYGEELLNKLKAGGLVIYFRHFATDNTQHEMDKTRPRHPDITAQELMTSCDLQRPLSDYGRLQAKFVFRGITENNIPVGRVLSSPYCRAVEGAELAFGPNLEVQRNLIYRTEQFPREITSRHIASILGEKPIAGNTFVMSHRPQMDDISKIKEGEAFVFEPLGDSTFNLLGRIQPAEWLLVTTDPFALGASYFQKYFYSKGARSAKEI